MYNRAPNLAPAFIDDQDRIAFLGIVAEAACELGVLVACFCLMGTHYHLVIHDVRGMISQFAQKLGTAYTMYFNRRHSRMGPLFQGRFKSPRIKDAAHLENVCAYVLRNPLETTVPLVDDIENYRWSSAALCLGPKAGSDAVVARLLAGENSDAYGQTLAQSQDKRSAKKWAERVRLLAAGQWLRAPDVMRSPQFLTRLAGGPEAEAAADLDLNCANTDQEQSNAPALPAGVSVSMNQANEALRFTGVELATASDVVHEQIDRVMPLQERPNLVLGNDVAAKNASTLSAGEVESDNAALHMRSAAYLLWRFTRASLESIAAHLATSVDNVGSWIQHCRANRFSSRAWLSLFWQLEWSLCWKLKASPIRG
jgi:hypothetical protein